MDEYEKSKIHTKRYNKIKTLLKMIYGYDNFKPKQYEIINRIVAREDVCAILPTGYGKSLTFQIPALYLDMPAIIVSPLISLMDDQRIILDKLGISSCCYNSTANKSAMRRDILQLKYKLVYITPEAMINLKDFLVELEKKQGISLIAIDEAHCISSYGFDFRPSYRELAFLKDILPHIPILAVTATATQVVSADICKVLQFKKHDPIKTSFDRPNLFLEVGCKSLESKINSDVLPIVKKHIDGSIIIYCLRKRETVEIASVLGNNGIKCGIYHAGLDNDKRSKCHQKFIEGKVKIVAATIAFGMGINKTDVRVVIHYGAPKNIESYYQEIGRAGRDGKEAHCYTFYSKADFMIQKSFIMKPHTSDYSPQFKLFQETQLKLLSRMESYLKTQHCRRKILLEYFGDESKDKCQFCDNCCGIVKPIVEPQSTQQDIQKEAKLLIDLIESIKNRNFGINMYISILRGSSGKNMTPTITKNKYYSTGKHRSANWWRELSENLIRLGYLQQIYLKSRIFAMPIIKVTQQGITWANFSELGELLDNVTIPSLGPIKMITNT